MSVKFIIDEDGQRTGVILDIKDYEALTQQKAKEDNSQIPENDPLLKAIGSVGYGNLTDNIDQELYGE